MILKCVREEPAGPNIWYCYKSGVGVCYHRDPNMASIYEDKCEKDLAVSRVTHGGFNNDWKFTWVDEVTERANYQEKP